ncbi:MAG: hypothetical protein JSS57_22150 [Proteobacteria bacterium]|nr:hypothetical protein [Pseudomonadota bacterium]
MNALLIIAIALLVAAVVLCRRVSFARAAIDLRQPVDNTARKFGEATEYFRADVIDHAGATQVALLTRDAVQEGLLRGLRNQEDL